jgi:Zn-dependent membrane protease YugP
VRCHGSILFVPLFYSVLVISVFASNRLDAASSQLSWVDNSNNEDGFHVERKLGNNGIFSFVATVGPNETFYIDDNLDDNTTYCYRVNAFNDVGISA